MAGNEATRAHYTCTGTLLACDWSDTCHVTELRALVGQHGHNRGEVTA